MDEAFKKELIEHCKRQMQRFERMGRTDSFAYKEHAVLLSFLERPYLPFLYSNSYDRHKEKNPSRQRLRKKKLSCNQKG